MQLKFGLKKEWMEYFGTKRWLAFFLPILFFIIADPIVILITPLIMESMSAIPGMEALSGQIQANQAMALQAFSADFMNMGLLALVLSMMRTAGGDQKNHSCVIPICNGFSRSVYILAKFIVYPAVAFVSAFASFGLVYIYSGFLFSDHVTLLDALPAAMAFGLFMAFAAALMLSVGCMTGKAGISAIIVYIVIYFVSVFLTMIQVNRFSPLALMQYASDYTGAVDWEYFLTIAITLAAGVLLYFLTAAVFQKCLLNKSKS
ncbi:MAG: hypothetical protein PUB00_06955 [Clostridiales bacterium]|nr:hypothetical protein [Clostridiales bacterium]